MPKREAELKRAFTREMRKQLPHFIMQLFASAGSPDRSITGDGCTTHWEFKHGTPDFVSHGDQELMCMRLAAQGHCRYVVWQEQKNGAKRRTMIVHPRIVWERSDWNIIPEVWSPGYDMQWLVNQIREAHGLR